MSEREDRVRLQHMLDAARQAIAFVQGRRRNDLDTDLHASGQHASGPPGTPYATPRANSSRGQVLCQGSPKTAAGKPLHRPPQK